MDVVDVPIKDIQVRFRFRSPSDKKVEGIAESIEKVGLISPVTIDNSNNLICGFHRLLAHKKLERKTIPAIIKETDNRFSELIELDENIQRNPLNVIEMADHIQRREDLMDELGLTYQQGDNRYTSEETKLTIEDLATSIGLSKRAYQLRKQVAKLHPEVKSLLAETEFGDSLMYLAKLSSESDDVQKRVCKLLITGKTAGWKTAIYEAKVADFKLKTKPTIDFNVCERFGTPRSIMKFNPSPTELSNIINLVNHDEDIRPKKSETRFGLTDVRLHQMNPDQCLFALDYYTNPNDLILDCFSGRSTTAITSLYLQRRFIGFEINAAANNKTRNLIKNHMDVPEDNYKIIDGDGCDMHELKDEIQIIDAVFTSPPYYNKAESYSKDERDLCNMSIEDFDSKIDEMFKNLARVIKKSNYEEKIFHPVMMVIGTARDKKNGIQDMQYSFQAIAKKYKFTLWDSVHCEVNNPHLVCSIKRNYEFKFTHKSHETQLTWVMF